MAARPWSTFARACSVCALVLVAGIGCRLFEGNVPAPASGPLLPGQHADVFTVARPTVGAAVSEFFGRMPAPVQPIEFPHNIHAGRQIGCTEYCHEGVTMGAEAGLPSVRTCMICHTTFAANRPRIIQITEMHAKGIDLAWERVFGYPPEAHVRFDHAPHIRAGVECSTCHGDIAAQTVAQRNVHLTMGMCVNCHAENNASIDCLTCHF